MNIADFEEKMKAYSFRQHQAFLTYLQTLSQHGLTIKDTKQYLREKREQLAELERQAQKTDNFTAVIPKCPECDTKLGLRTVSTPKGPANRYGWRSCLECPRCGYEQYKRQTVDQLLLDLSKRRKS